MDEKHTDALKVGAAIAIAVAVGLGLFLYSGSMAAVAFFALGVPVLLVVAGAVYQRQVRNAGSTRSPKLESMTEDLAGDIESMLSTYDRLSRSEHWSPGEFAGRIKDLGQELENRGIKIEEADGGYQVTVERVEMGPGAINRYRQRVESIRDGLVSEYREYTEQQAAAIEEQLQRLESEGLIEQSASVGWASNAPSDSLSELERTVDEQRDTFHDYIWNAIDRIRATEGSLSLDGQGVDTAVEKGRFKHATDIVIEARDRVKGEAQERFEANREELLRLIKAVRSSGATQYCSRSHLDRLESIESDITSLDSVFEEDRLRTKRQETLRICKEILEELESTLIDYIDEFNRGDVPPDYSERPPVVDRDHADHLEAATDLANFRQRWKAAVADLIDALDDAEARRGALVAYPDIVGELDDALSKTGEVLPEHVPYDPPEYVMEIYAARNPEVTYLETEPRVTHGADIASQEFDLEVEVTISPPETVSVEVDVEGPNTETHRAKRVDRSDEFVFTSLPGGKVEVTAAAESPRFETVSEQVRLDDDRRIDLTLKETTMRERICGDIEDESRVLLKEVETDITRQFQSSQYLDDRMDIGVQAKYAPCILALWAEQEDMSIWQADDDHVMIYDRDRLTNQLVNLVEHKLEEGDSMEYTEFRERYLTVPAPDDLIADVLADQHEESAVKLTEDTVVKS